MSRFSSKKAIITLTAIGLGVVAGYAIAETVKTKRRGKRRSQSGLSLFDRLLGRAVTALDRVVPWYRQPRPLGVLGLVGLRSMLREKNLYDTETISATEPAPLETTGTRYLTARTADGTFNDLEDPRMGALYTRFGRNFPFEHSYPEPGPGLLIPNPRTVSRELLTRDPFIPAATLNVLAAAWLQFMVHDWFSHGHNEPEDPVEIPLKEDDPWPAKPMTIRRTHQDPTRPPGSDGPPTFINFETHWWDGSQIYGTSTDIEARVRSWKDGKLKLGSDGLLPLDPETGVDVTGVTGNYWLGLSLLHTLFTLEHNAICDRLKAEYPTWSDDELFDHARLVNAALMAKIHTVEWTPGIVAHPTVQFGMRGNWWGLLGEGFHRRFGRIGRGDFLSGIIGSDTNHHAAPYSLTEEFVAVYRMHALMPDDFEIRACADNRLLQELTFPQVEGRNVRKHMEETPLTDLLYSFGTSHPGAVTLHNFPRFLQQMKKPSGRLIDLATVDILRDRERGVPRYNQFRRLLRMRPVESFEELTDNPLWAEEIRRVYDNDIERVDLMIGLYAEPLPPGFGFSETAFRIFALMASRRLKSDRFFTTYYTPEVYTKAGMDWIDENDMSTVLLRHFPGLEPCLRGVGNAFAPWSQPGAA